MGDDDDVDYRHLAVKYGQPDRDPRHTARVHRRRENQALGPPAGKGIKQPEIRVRLPVLGLKREFLESLAQTAKPQYLDKAVSFLKVAFPTEGRHEAFRCTQRESGSGAMSEYGTKPKFTGYHG